MKKLIRFAIAILLLAASIQARANIIIAPQTVSFVGISNGRAHPNDRLYITYEVDEIRSGIFEYEYDLQTIDPKALTSFTIGGADDPLITTGLSMLDYGHAEENASGFNSDSIGWDWGFNSDVTCDHLSFISDVAPGYADFTANDDDMAWTSPALLAAPVPEPSAFTLLAVSAFAFCLLKDRLRTPRS
ncbi:MAG TPA: hypothetical protein VH280_10105 [Verrucomicrobiae bacterium]|jgi:hypothetical protein|nr:hypothetical protein [Verrucomicrobiae bacterium]